MLKKTIVTVLALSFFGLLFTTSDALAKRRCPRGFEDVNNVCVPK